MPQLARVAHFTVLAARSVVAVFAASTAAIIACGVVPVLLMRMPFSAMLYPSRPFLLFALAYSATVGIPFFYVLSRRRRLIAGTYMRYGVELACLAMIALGFDYSAPSLFEVRRLFDLSWIVLTSGVPAGLVAGAIAHQAMTVARP
ncbi:hypothetical protein ACVIGB_000968 [Bradyrhizobium sp. USDA 4341]